MIIFEILKTMTMYIWKFSEDVIAISRLLFSTRGLTMPIVEWDVSHQNRSNLISRDRNENYYFLFPSHHLSISIPESRHLAQEARDSIDNAGFKEIHVRY